MSLEPLTVTIKEAKRLTGLCHVTLYKLMREGKVRHTKVGRRTLLGYASLQEFLNVGQSMGKRMGRTTKKEKTHEKQCLK